MDGSSNIILNMRRKIRIEISLMGVSAQLLRALSGLEPVYKINSFLLTDKYLIVSVYYVAVYLSEMMDLFSEIKFKANADFQLDEPKRAIADEEKPMFRHVSPQFLVYFHLNGQGLAIGERW